MNEKKLFGKYHDLIILVLGFILTGVIGTYISWLTQEKAAERDFKLQEQLFDYQNSKEYMERDRRKAEDIFNDLSQLMDKRLYVSRHYIDAKCANEPKKLEDIKLKNNQMLEEWNIVLNKNLTILEMYFGLNGKNYFNENIHGVFRQITSEIANLKPGDKNEASEIQKQLDNLNMTVCWFDKRLLWAIEGDRVGKFKYNGDTLLMK